VEKEKVTVICLVLHCMWGCRLSFSIPAILSIPSLPSILHHMSSLSTLFISLSREHRDCAHFCFCCLPFLFFFLFLCSGQVGKYVWGFSFPLNRCGKISALLVGRSFKIRYFLEPRREFGCRISPFLHMIDRLPHARKISDAPSAVSSCLSLRTMLNNVTVPMEAIGKTELMFYMS